MKPTRSIYINASRAAALLGHNKYAKQHQEFEAVWQKVCPVSYENAQRRNSVSSDASKLAEILRKEPEIRLACANAPSISAQSSSSAEVAAAHTATSSSLPVTSLSPKERALVRDELRARFFTSYGCHNETDVFRRVRDAHPGMNIVEGGGVYYKRLMGSIRGIDWYIGGKIDAISGDGSCVIEIKNRVNRLFGKVADYEMVQLQWYLHLLPAARSALLVECYRPDANTVQLGSQRVDKDPGLWDIYMAKTRVILEYLIDVLEDPGKQDFYMRSSRKSALLSDIINFSMGIKYHHHHHASSSPERDCDGNFSPEASPPPPSSAAPLADN
jgi:hypothetical protein